jgi:hypothetical protein
MAHLIKATRDYKDGRLRVTYWCGKNEVVPAHEEFTAAPSKPPRRSDCRRCVAAREPRRSSN